MHRFFFESVYIFGSLNCCRLDVDYLGFSHNCSTGCRLSRFHTTLPQDVDYLGFIQPFPRMSTIWVSYNPSPGCRLSGFHTTLPQDVDYLGFIQLFPRMSTIWVSYNCSTGCRLSSVPCAI